MTDSAGTAPSEVAATRDRTDSVMPIFQERLRVSWWAWPLPLLGAGLMAMQVHMGNPGLRAWLPYVVLMPLAVLGMVWLGRVRVRLSSDEIHVGKAHLPLRFVGEVEVVTSDQKRKALGPELDPAAFVVHRPWVGPMLWMELTDPDDPTPYWLFSVRDPERLKESILKAKAGELAAVAEGS
ncbi:hypothetical protein BKA25_003789 [Actinoalloteichus hymeniacidonis]|uniref:DUF3093 family protein n=2 Tax=Actinoalloteichus hymeniacidonis TaxID=340345 RepID=A0AAC9HP91_9PSEU|nr:DUF3093 domain-containing protein [Actinoalloteichus hymeniacidonis]AOS62496.1 putative DUF3093 family protein [Actinoalloteichus hymeniacidonis]MBB5909473.1 hypothetical protein [Actinoalloteichus hymeniacidonis]